VNNRGGTFVSLEEVSIVRLPEDDNMSHCTRAVEAFGGGRIWLEASVLLAVTCSIAVGADHGRRSHATVSKEYFEARQLFVKIWEPGVASRAGGDGLGPLYNESSCVGCHHLGGTGGAGGNDRNVVILSAFAGPPTAEKGKNVFQGELEDLHPGFRNHTSVVLHNHAIALSDEARLSTMKTYTTVQTREELIELRSSERNTPALFGAGLIDAIPDSSLLEAEKRQFSKFPEIKGRVSRLRDGRLGRFGWKGQTARLRDFVLAACSNELGLEVPGHHQASLAAAKEFDPSKLHLDMDEQECDLLVEFVRSLPRPILRAPRDNTVPPWGYTVFETVGCATCHAPRLGSVNGLYSDLLLHDLGDRISASGGYGSSAAPGSFVDRSKVKDRVPSSGEATPTEWRTTPLWGVADSAPYLHNGRASTLDEAIRLHGGEAAATSERYTKLSAVNRKTLLAFLQSLSVSPTLRKPKANVAKRPS